MDEELQERIKKLEKQVALLMEEYYYNEIQSLERSEHD